MGQRPGIVPELVDGERRRQVAVGVDLGEQLVCLLLDRRDRIGVRDPAERWVLLVDDSEQSLRKLGGITALLAARRFPRGRAWAVRSA